MKYRKLKELVKKYDEKLAFLINDYNTKYLN